MKNDKNVKIEYLALKAENDRIESELLEKHGSLVPPKPKITLAVFRAEPEESDE